MSTNFEFDAPQFINFANMDDPKADNYFDFKLKQEEDKNKVLPKDINKASLNNHCDVENKDPLEKDEICKKDIPILRKVLHEIVNHQIQNDEGMESKETHFKNNEKGIIHQFEKLHLSEVKQRKSKAPLRATESFGSVIKRPSEYKSHQMITRLDALSLKKDKTFSRISSESLPYEDHSIQISDNNVISTTSTTGKLNGVKRNASPLHSTTKFISLAEQVEHFYKDTPDRYRSKPKKQFTSNNQPWKAKPGYVPKTPNLITKFRQRKINFPNEQEREEMELEEMKKNQIKAYPLKEKVLMTPLIRTKVPITKKPTTIPQPFSLTETKKKELPEEPIFHFKAQPVPSSILEGPVGIPPKKIAAVTVPVAPQIRVPSRFRAKTPESSPCIQTVSNCKTTKIEPFSFDARIKETQERKERRIREILEEERKSHGCFKAQPMPSVRKIFDCSPRMEKSMRKTEPQPFNLTKTKERKIEPEIHELKVTPFKARPAKVIHQKPFVPKYEKHEMPLPVDITLQTMKRAAERQKFDEKIKQKEEEHALIIKLQKEEEEKRELERAAEQRKKAEFKAKPMPYFKPFEIQSGDPEKLTLPRSPMFSFKKKESK